MNRFLCHLVLAGIIAIIVTSCGEDAYTPAGNTYTITFNADGGDGTVPAPRTVHAEYVSTNVVLPDANLSKGESSFIGWREPGFIYIYSCPGESISVWKDIELKAVYENDPTIPTPSAESDGGKYVTRTGNKYHKYGHMGATIPIGNGTNSPYAACSICY